MSLPLIIGLIGGFVLFSIGFYFLTVAVAARCIYLRTFSRKPDAPRERKVSIQTETALQMDEIGMAWQREHDAYKKDVHMVRDGLNFYGEYYDFGANKAVIILSGRTESLRYGYYFAKPYADAGYNVLVIDSRTHGFSDGTYITFGFEESKDALEWVRLLNGELGVKHILFHGICIGAAAGMLALTSPDCPDCVKGIVTEGMFPNFAESMKNHLIERKRLWFPVMQLLDRWSRKCTGHSMKTGPIDVIPRMDKPILMIQSKADLYSTADYAKQMYALCPSSEKKLVLYETGGHSLLRITDTDTYDGEITLFLHRLRSIGVID